MWRLLSRLLTQIAMHADRLANQRLARADARKWHHAVLAALQEFGPASQAAHAAAATCDGSTSSSPPSKTNCSRR